MRFSASRLPTSARFSCRRSLWSLRALNTVVSSGAEVAREVELAVVVELLVWEDQHGVLGEGGADGRKVVGGERLAEHDIAHFGGEIGGDRLYGDGHGVLL